MRPPLLLVGGLDPTGMAGLGRDVTTCAAFGIHGCPVPTCTTVQTTEGVTQILPTPVEHMVALAEAAISEHAPTWMKVGVIPSRSHAEALADLVRRRGLQVVHDPVLAPTRGPAFSDPGDLFPLLDVAHLVTPNTTEAEALSLTDSDHIHITRGGDLPGTHRGTGCRLSTAIACGLANGLDQDTAIDAAHAWLEPELKADLRQQQASDGEQAHLAEAHRCLALLLAELHFEHIPEVGINFAYAMPGAKDPHTDVAGLAGRITIAGFHRAWTGRVAFGGPHHTGRIAVVLQEYDPQARLVMNHRYDPTFLQQAERGGLEVRSFRREDEPHDAPSSMEWGVRHAIETNGGRVPDLIWDAGGPGKEPMIRIIASSPEALAKTLRIMHGREDPSYRPASSTPFPIRP